MCADEAGTENLAATFKPPTRIDRAKRGRVPGPVPWVLVGEGRVWAWDQAVGLVRLIDAEEPGQPVFQWDALTPDGRFLCYLSVDMRDDGRIVYEIETGKWTSGPVVADDGSFLGSFPPLGDGQRLDILQYNLHGRPRLFHNGRYTVHRGDQVIVLPIDDKPGLPLEGPRAQFSPNGDEVAIGHDYVGEDRYGYSTSVVDIDSGEVTRYDGLGVSTCATWSPSAGRLLLRGVQDQLPTVVDRVTGVLSPLKKRVFADPSWRYSSPLVSGWLDDTRVMISGLFGRRIIIATLDVDTGKRVDLLDIPRPAGTADQGIRLAPLVAQADPTSVGPVIEDAR